MLVKSVSGDGFSTRCETDGRVSAVIVDTPVLAVVTDPPPVATALGVLVPTLDDALILVGGAK
jgi:hypothetical protein